MVSIIMFFLSLLSGAVGGNIAGNIARKYDLGMTGNTIAGLIGGAIGGPIVNYLMRNPESMIGVLTNMVGSGFAGAVLMLIMGLIKNAGTRTGHQH